MNSMPILWMGSRKITTLIENKMKTMRFAILLVTLALAPIGISAAQPALECQKRNHHPEGDRSVHRHEHAVHEMRRKERQDQCPEPGRIPIQPKSPPQQVDKPDGQRAGQYGKQASDQDHQGNITRILEIVALVAGRF